MNSQAVNFKVKPTLMMLLMVVLPHVLALFIALFLVPVSWLVKLGLVFLLVLSFWYFLRLHVLQSLHHSLIRIQQDSAGNWLLTVAGDDKNQHLQGKLLPSSFISPYVLILNFSGSNRLLPYTALITPNSLPPQDFRRLRVRLKTMKKPMS